MERRDTGSSPEQPPPSIRTRRTETTYASFGDVVVVVHDVSRQSKVADLHYLALREQDVPGGQISVDTLQGETHTCAYSRLLMSPPSTLVQLQMAVLALRLASIPVCI